MPAALELGDLRRSERVREHGGGAGKGTVQMGLCSFSLLLAWHLSVGAETQEHCSAWQLLSLWAQKKHCG